MAQELKDIKIGQPVLRALKDAGINNLLQLCKYSEKELLALHGVGPKAIRLININLDAILFPKIKFMLILGIRIV